MRKLAAITLLAFALSPAAWADKRYYKYVDENGNIVLGDKIPVEDSERKKYVVNDHGVEVGRIEGKKTEAELAAERRAEEQKLATELRLRADRALLNTYLTIEEIMLHRDRRVELWQAQARVTELYLRNLERRLEMLKKRSRNFSPYSDDEDAPMIGSDLLADLQETEATIVKHMANLENYKEEEEQIRARFEGDIERFKHLKGLE